MREYIELIENAIQLAEGKEKIKKGQTVTTPMGKGKVVKIDTEDNIDGSRSLTGHLGTNDKRVKKKAKVEFEDGREQWFSMFQLS